MPGFFITPSTVSGQLSVPPSKSQTLRAILFASLASGESVVSHPLAAPDTDEMIQCCLSLGAKVIHDGLDLRITGISGKLPDYSLQFHAGNSGIILRFMSAVAACGSGAITISGDASLCRRPMSDMTKAFQLAGAQVEFLGRPGFAPLTVRGPLKDHAVSLEGIDSQPVSAFLIAGALTGQRFEVHVANPGEIPWVDMTLEWLQRLGVEVAHEAYRFFVIQCPEIWPGFTYNVPGDWSTAAFPIAAALVTGSSIKIDNLEPKSTQGDRKIVEILQDMGADIRWSENTLEVGTMHHLKGIEIDINPCIDALPVLSVVASVAKGKTRIFNGAVARTKESDRVSCLAIELRKMGVQVKELADGLEIEGGVLSGASLQSHGDHRLAMALAVAALGASSPTTIKDVACVSKTYPQFLNDFIRVGARIERLT